MGGESEQQKNKGSRLYEAIRESIKFLDTGEPPRATFLEADTPKFEIAGETLLPGVLSNIDHPKCHLRRYLRKQGAGLLERAAVALGKTLSEEQQTLAAFERDYWLGLAERGQDWEKSEEFFCKQFGSIEKVPYVDLDDLKLTKLTLGEWEEKKLLTLRPNRDGWDGYTECLARGELPRLKQALLLGFVGSNDVDDLNKVKRVTFIGAPRFVDYFSTLFVSEYWRSRCLMFFRLGRYTLEFEINFLSYDPGSVNDLVSDMLATVLWSGRPLRYYSATFYCSLGYVGDKRPEIKGIAPGTKGVAKEYKNTPIGKYAFPKLEPEGIRPYEEYKDDAIKAQVVRYFSPRLREQIFHMGESPESGIKSIEEYSLPHESLDNITLKLIQCDADTQCKPPFDGAEVKDVSLYRHHLKHDLLAFRIEMPVSVNNSWDDPKCADQTNWWHDLFERKQNPECVQLERWLNFTQMVRILYPSFLEQWKEKKICDMQIKDLSSDPPATSFKIEDFNSVITHLLSKFYQDSEDIDRARERLMDESRNDRMFVNVAYALAGPVPSNQWAKQEFNRIHHIALHVDRQKDTSPGEFAYSRQFCQEQQKYQVYRRWEELGSLHGFTDHSHVYMGLSREARERIAPIHVPHIYGRMTVLNLFYQSLFSGYEFKISEATPSSTDKEGSKTPKQELGGSREGKTKHDILGKLRDEFMEFTNRYWFHEVTEQQQGKEIYELQSRAMGFKESHNIVKEEIEKTEDYEKCKVRDRLTCVGLVITFAAVFVGLLSVDAIKEIIGMPVAAYLISLTKQAFLVLRDVLSWFKPAVCSLEPITNALAFMVQFVFSMLLTTTVIFLFIRMLGLGNAKLHYLMRMPGLGNIKLHYLLFLTLYQVIILVCFVVLGLVGFDSKLLIGITTLLFVIVSLAGLILFKKLFLPERCTGLDKRYED